MSQFLPVDEARKELETRLGMRGWSRTSIRRKIAASHPFVWKEGKHFLQDNGIRSINVEQVVDDLLKTRSR